jgi:hypothetical protein
MQSTSGTFQFLLVSFNEYNTYMHEMTQIQVTGNAKSSQYEFDYILHRVSQDMTRIVTDQALVTNT